MQGGATVTVGSASLDVGWRREAGLNSALIAFHPLGIISAPSHRQAQRLTGIPQI
jgi:hypothetical protein